MIGLRWCSGPTVNTSSGANTVRSASAPVSMRPLAVFAPDEAFTVGPLHHRNPITPYAGATLHGVVRETWLRGAPVAPAAPRGRLLTREDPTR